MRGVSLLLLLFLLLCAVVVKEAASGDFSLIGKSAPAFELPDLNGANTSLSAFKGSVVLVNFWATWCASCKAEMPSLDSLYGAHKNQGFVVLAVALDPSEKQVKKLIAEKGTTFPVLMDKDKDVSFDLYAVVSLPVSFLIDRNGVVAEKLIGERDWGSSAIQEKILKLLKKRDTKNE